MTDRRVDQTEEGSVLYLCFFARWRERERETQGKRNGGIMSVGGEL